MNTSDPVAPPMDTQQDWRRGLMDIFGDQRWSHRITLAWNRDVSHVRARADIRDLLHRIDRRLLGSRFHKKPAALRTRALFVFESIAYNLHVHSLWHCVDARRLKPFNHLFPGERGGLWNDVVVSGSYDVNLVGGPGDHDKFTGYLLKPQHKNSDGLEFIWSGEFHRTD